MLVHMWCGALVLAVSLASTSGENCTVYRIPHAETEVKTLGPRRWNYVEKKYVRNPVFTKMEIGTVVSPDDDIYVRCNARRSFHGTGVEAGRVTCSMGKFVPSPICLLDDCQVLWVSSGHMEERTLGPERWSSTESKYVRDPIIKKLNTSDIPYRDSDVHLRCHPGYTVHGRGNETVKITCVDGNWYPEPVCSKTGDVYVERKIRPETTTDFPATREPATTTRLPPKTTCAAPPSPEHGSVEFSSGGAGTLEHEAGTVAFFSCEEDRFPDGPSTSKCLRIRQWTFPPPRCLAWCSMNDLVFYGLEKGSKQIYRDGEEFEIRCKPRYTLAEDQGVRMLCEDGVWRGPMPPCVAAPPEAGTSSERGTQNGAPGSELVDGQSSSYSENCFCSYENVYLQLIADIGGYRLQLGDILEKGETAVLSCGDPTKYQLWPNGLVTSAQTRLTCSACEIWQTSSLPICIDHKPADKVRCHRLDSKGIFNISYSNSLQIGSVARYLCVEGSQALIGPETRSCMGTGDWSDIEPRCIADGVRCPDLYNKGTFNIRYSKGQQMGSVARYSCKEKSQAVIGPESRACLWSGKWSGIEPKCINDTVRCPGLHRNQMFSVRYSNGRQMGSVARFSCKNDAQALIGPETRVCLWTGVWSGMKPRCITDAVRCPELDNKGIFSISYSNGHWMGSVARYSCQVTKYLDSFGSLSPSEVKTMIGRNTRACLWTGVWSHKEPKCITNSVRCPGLNNKGTFNIGYSNGQRMGSIARYSCKDDSQAIIGPETRTCLETADWSGMEPRCI